MIGVQWSGGLLIRGKQLRRHNLKWMLLAAATIMAGGCESLPGRQDAVTTDIDAVVDPLVTRTSASTTTFGAASSVDLGSSAGTPPRPQVYKGDDTGPVVTTLPATNYFAESGDGVLLNFDGTPLTEVAKTILGDLLSKTFIIEPGLGGQVTLISSSPIKRDSLMSVLESILQVNNAAVVRGNGGIYRVGPKPLLKGLAPVSSAASQTPGFSMRVIRLKFISASQMADILGPMIREDAIVRVDDRRNLLILGATRAEYEAVAPMIDAFDVHALKGMSVGVYPVENLTASSMAQNLDALFGKSGESPFSGVFRVIPLDGVNRVLVVSSNSSYLKEIETWIARLDFDDGTETRLFIYPVQNGSAEHLADMLTRLFSDGGSVGVRQRGDVAPGRSVSTAVSEAATKGESPGTSTLGGTSGVSTRSGGASATRAVELTTSRDSGPVKVVADTENNTLLIMADGASYRKIEAALKRLDAQPMQVLVEASIVEVGLSDELEYGLQWYFDNQIGGNKSETQLITAGAALAAKVPGFSWTLTDPSGTVKAVFNALAEDSRLRVLSSPSILVLDNHTAEIRVGDQQPVATSETVNTSATNVVTQNIEYKDTGVLLTVTPRVNAGGMIIMEVAQEVTDVGEIDAATGQRSFLQRNITSTVAVQSGETIVMGGLIRDRSARSNSGIPILKDLPGIGWAFSTNSSEGTRRELLVTLTPRAIRDTNEARLAGDELRVRMQRLVEEMAVR